MCDINSVPLETIQSALCYQITQYGLSSASRSDVCLLCMANSVVSHLQTLISHERVKDNPALRLAYNGMLNDWERIKLIHSNEYPSKPHPAEYH